MTGIILDNISKYFGEQCVIDQMNLRIPDGTVLVLVGPSGSGKTTLLRIMAGLLKPDSGKVYYGQTPLEEIEHVQRNIGMVFQTDALVPHWSAGENVGFWSRLRRREHEVPERVRRVSQITGIGIEHLMDRFPRQLSGGEKQRVAIARALARDLNILFFDEPFANLDPAMRGQARLELKRLLSAFKVTAVYVTHDQTEAVMLADRIAILNNGQIVQMGSFQDLYERPINQFVASFIGSPTMNFFKGRIEDGHWYGETFGGLKIRKDLENGTVVTMGIRPQDIYLESGGIPAVVDTVTPYYAEHYQLLSVWLGSERWQMVAPLNTQINAGETVYCNIDAKNAMYFDSRTGIRIG